MAKIPLKIFLCPHRNPDRHQNPIVYCQSHITPLQKSSPKLVDDFLSYPHANRQRDECENITSSAKVKKVMSVTASKGCVCCVLHSAKCGEPPVIDKASHNGPAASGYHGDGRGRLYDLGVQLVYTCAPGYYVHGFHKAICMSEGRWVGPRMTCRRTYDEVFSFFLQWSLRHVPYDMCSK